MVIGDGEILDDLGCILLRGQSAKLRPTGGTSREKGSVNGVNRMVHSTVPVYEVVASLTKSLLDSSRRIRSWEPRRFHNRRE